MQAIWVVDFQLPRGEFWESDPDEFARLYRAWERREKAEYVRAGVIVASIHNHTEGVKKPWGPEDVFPFLAEEQFVTPEEAHAAFAKHARRAPDG